MISQGKSFHNFPNKTNNNNMIIPKLLMQNKAKKWKRKKQYNYIKKAN